MTMPTKKRMVLAINGRIRQADVAPNATLLETLRDLGCFEVKSGCEKGDCGACAVLVDGRAVDSCLTLAWTVEGKQITTVEGLQLDGARHPLQETFIARGAIQCGFCTPGILIAAKSLLDRNPRPSEDEVRQALSGNLCRCTGYTKVFEAVETAAAVMRGEGTKP
jgi:carbon-monoxide dehydrogenase small subunit